MDKEAKKALENYLIEQEMLGRNDEFLNFIKEGVKKNHLRFTTCMCKEYGFTLNDDRWNRCPNCGCL